jgi:hypothetical protein
MVLKIVNLFYNLYNKMNLNHKVFNSSDLVNYINDFVNNEIHFNDLINLHNGVHIFYNTLILDNNTNIKPIIKKIIVKPTIKKYKQKLVFTYKKFKKIKRSKKFKKFEKNQLLWSIKKQEKILKIINKLSIKDLDKNQIKKISNFIENKLQHISKCIINYDNTNIKQIISFIFSLLRLKSVSFNMYFNYLIDGLFINQKLLTELDFSDSYNKPLGNSLNNLINLQKLYFGRNFNQPLGNSLNNLINLQKLYFGRNFNQPLGNSLNNLINLQKLYFGRNFNQPLGNSLNNLTNLQKLYFGDNFNQPLGNSLNNLTNLQILYSKNEFTQMNLINKIIILLTIFMIINKTN